MYARCMLKEVKLWDALTTNEYAFVYLDECSNVCLYIYAENMCKYIINENYCENK